MDFETIIILSAILELITLICFFVLCSNVSAIRKKLCKDDILSSSLIAMYMGLGEKEKAREALIECIVSKSTLREHLLNDNGANMSLAPYRKLMKELDVEFDAEIAKDIKKKFGE